MSATVRHVNADPEAVRQADELRDFLLIVRRALLLIVAYIDKRYNVSKT